MYIVSKGEKKAHTVNKRLAISGIVLAIVVSIAGFIVSGLQISGSRVLLAEFIKKLLIPFALIILFGLVQAIVLMLINWKCKKALKTKKCFFKALYEIFVARDVRLIFIDQKVLKEDVCRHDKVVPGDNDFYQQEDAATVESEVLEMESINDDDDNENQQPPRNQAQQNDESKEDVKEETQENETSEMNKSDHDIYVLSVR